MRKLLILLVPLIIVTFILGQTGCSNKDTPAPNARAGPAENPQPRIFEATPKGTPTSVSTITIGYLTDTKSPSSETIHFIDMALKDSINYYNEQQLLPGIELKILTYDTKNDSEQDIPGYEWLKENGADLIFSGIPTTGTNLKAMADADQFVIFEASGFEDMLDPPGYIFILGSVVEYEAYTLLKWISENDWDYELNGPAEIGGISWEEAHTDEFFAAIKEYSRAHPDQFKWISKYLTGSTWGPQVEALKSCNYVFPCVVPMSFIKAYSIANPAARFICTDAHLNSLGEMSDAGLWDEIDGALLASDIWWWSENSTIANLTEQLLQTYHPDEIEEIKKYGGSYLTTGSISLMLDIIAKAVENNGPENFNSQVLYDAIQSYTVTIDGIEGYCTLSGTKCYATNYYTIYEVNAEEKDLVNADGKRHPVVTTP